MAGTDLRYRAADRLPGRGLLPRLVVYVTLALLVTAVVQDVEMWPLSSFRLFSQTRGPVAIRWELVTLDAAGREVSVDFSTLGRPYRQGSHLLGRLPRATVAQRRDACDAWAQEVGTRALLVYRSHWRLHQRHGATPSLLRRRLVQDCRTA